MKGVVFSPYNTGKMKKVGHRVYLDLVSAEIKQKNNSNLKWGLNVAEFGVQLFKVSLA